MKKLKHFKLWISLVVIIVLVLLYYSSGYFFIYNNDAYVDADWVKVTSAVPGPITNVPVQDNQFVKKGTLMLQLEAQPFQIAIAQAKANLADAIAKRNMQKAVIAESKAQLVIEKDQAHLAKIELTRYQNLVSKGSVSIQTFQEKKTAYQTAEAMVSKAEADLNQSDKQLAVDNADIAAQKSLLDLAKYNFSKSKITAPADGFVNNMSVYTGDYAKVGETLFSFIKARTWRVVANIKEGNLVDLQPGKTVWLYLSSHPWHLYKGKVQSVGRGVSREPTPQNAGLPYVKPVTDWIRYPYRIPVRIQFVEQPPKDTLHVGTDARVFVF